MNQKHHPLLLLSATRDNTCSLSEWFTETALPLLPRFRVFVAKLHAHFPLPMNTKWRTHRGTLLFSLFYLLFSVKYIMTYYNTRKCLYPCVLPISHYCQNLTRISWRPQVGVQSVSLTMITRFMKKILATRLSKVVPSLIHLNLSGFVQGRLSLNNMRRLYHIIHKASSLCSPAVAISLDAENRMALPLFNSV